MIISWTLIGKIVFKREPDIIWTRTDLDINEKYIDELDRIMEY